MKRVLIVALLSVGAMLAPHISKACCGARVDKDSVSTVTPPPAAPKASDHVFVQKDGAAFGPPCRFNSGGTLVFDLPVDRVFGDKQKLLDNQLLPTEVELDIAFFDVDAGGGEVDLVTIGGFNCEVQLP